MSFASDQDGYDRRRSRMGTRERASLDLLGRGRDGVE